MLKRRTVGEIVFSIGNAAFMVAFMTLTLYPLIHVLAASLSLPGRLIKHTGALFWPLGFTTESFKLVFDNPMIWQGYQNTLFLVVFGTLFNVLLTSLGAYVLSRRGYMLKPLFTFMAVFTMFFSGGLIPFYLQVNALGMRDSLLALIIPTAVSTYNLIVLRTAFAGVPASLEEAARLDGASDWVILFRVILPVCMASIAVMLLFYGVDHWNGWFNAVIFLRTRDRYPLQVVLREILISSSTDTMVTGVAGGDREMIGETVKYATIVVATLPILAVYPYLQKYFIKGVMIGAVKG